MAKFKPGKLIVTKGAEVRQHESEKHQKFLGLKLLFAFLLIKLTLYVFSVSWYAQLIVPLLLVSLALGAAGKHTFLQVRRVFSSPPDWADGICLFFFSLPLVLSALLLGKTSVESFHLWRVWLVNPSSGFSVLVAPIAEEIFFRGWLLDQQLRRCSQVQKLSATTQMKIVYLNALAFWLMHAPIDPTLWYHSLNEGLVPLSPGPFLLGLATAALTLKTGHIRAAIVFHSIANSHGPLWWPLLKHDWVRNLFYQ